MLSAGLSCHVVGISRLLSESRGSVGGGNRFGFGGLDARNCVCGKVTDVCARFLWFGYVKWRVEYTKIWKCMLLLLWWLAFNFYKWQILLFQETRLTNCNEAVSRLLCWEAPVNCQSLCFLKFLKKGDGKWH